MEKDTTGMTGRTSYTDDETYFDKTEEVKP